MPALRNKPERFKIFELPKNTWQQNKPIEIHVVATSSNDSMQLHMWRHKLRLFQHCGQVTWQVSDVTHAHPEQPIHCCEAIGLKHVENLQAGSCWRKQHLNNPTTTGLSPVHSKPLQSCMLHGDVWIPERQNWLDIPLQLIGIHVSSSSMYLANSTIATNKLHIAQIWVASPGVNRPCPVLTFCSLHQAR